MNGTDTTDERPADDPSAAEDALFDPELARNPQPAYKAMRDLAPVVEMDAGSASGRVALGMHEDIVAGLRTPDVFSSGFDAVRIGQVRPLIPLQIDPPDHHTYRKLLDPLFAPREVATLEPRVRELAHDLVDAVVDDGACNFNAAFAEPFPSHGVPRAAGPARVASPRVPRLQGRHHPAAGDRRPRSARRWSPRRDARSTPCSRRSSTPAPREPRDDFISGFLTAEVDGHRLSREDDHRHLLPVLPRRARHRDRVARLHARLPRPAPRPPAPDRRRPGRSSPTPSRRCCGGRRRCPGWCG